MWLPLAFEYAFGCLLMMIGEIEKGTEVFAAVRDRYRGHNRNSWNEMECGSNYARSMSSYAAVPVLAGFSFDLGRGNIGFDPKVHRNGHFRTIWSTGSGWGEVLIEDGAVSIKLLGGTINLASISVQNAQFDARAISEPALKKVVNDRVEVVAGDVIVLRDPAIRICSSNVIAI